MQKILRNSSNKILRNNSGKVMRQNYNMPLFYQVDYPNGQNQYLRVENPFGLGNAIPQTISVVVRSNPNIYTDGNRGGFWRIGSADNPVILGTFGRLTQTQYLFSEKTSETDYTNNATLVNSSTINNVKNYGVITYVIDEANKKGISYANAWSYEKVYTSSVRPDIITEFILGRSCRGTKSYEYYHSNAGFYEMLVFDRLITQEEHLHFWNLGKGNAPLSEIGLLFRIRCDKVEILDFSDTQDGSDMRVGVPDLTGNNKHAEFMLLPAGTLEEQRQFAEDTLIVKSYPPRY